MRQLRIKSNLCSNQRIISICQDDYSLLNEEKIFFKPKWIGEGSNKEEEEYSSTIIKSFKYQSDSGYVYEFRGSLLDLQNNIYYYIN